MMVSDCRISLDTNIFIVGLRFPNTVEAFLLAHLTQFQTRIAYQVEIELRRNLTGDELKRFYSLIHSGIPLELTFSHPPKEFVDRYRDKGLKKGDAYIGAFCEWQNIAIFISMNRHFLKELADPLFLIKDTASFCQEYITAS